MVNYGETDPFADPTKSFYLKDPAVVNYWYNRDLFSHARHLTLANQAMLKSPSNPSAGLSQDSSHDQASALTVTAPSENMKSMLSERTIIPSKVTHTKFSAYCDHFSKRELQAIEEMDTSENMEYGWTSLPCKVIHTQFSGYCDHFPNANRDLPATEETSPSENTDYGWVLIPCEVTRTACPSYYYCSPIANRNLHATEETVPSENTESDHIPRDTFPCQAIASKS